VKGKVRKLGYGELLVLVLVLVLQTRANAGLDANSRFATDVSIWVGRTLRLRPYSQIIFPGQTPFQKDSSQAQQQHKVGGTSALAWGGESTDLGLLNSTWAFLL
jgi:hypothetical protein